MARKTLIRGFDYVHGEPCAHTAREWDDIRREVFTHGGFARKCFGEEWLFSKEHKFAFEIYWHGGILPPMPQEMQDKLLNEELQKIIQKRLEQERKEARRTVDE